MSSFRFKRKPDFKKRLFLKKTFEKTHEIHPRINDLKFSIEDLRFSTPYEIAEYRAQRLKCKVIVDACSGLGFQSFAFAKSCEKVIAIERDPAKIMKAKENAGILGIKNITFLEGDVLNKEITRKVEALNPEIVFCDPERMESEKERVLDTIKPNIDEFFKIYSEITDKIAIEVPPFIQDIKFDCEKEYLEYNDRKHLTLYLGSLKKSEKNAIILPEKILVELNGKITDEEREYILKRGKIEKYIYELKEIVGLAGLVPEFIQKFLELKLRVLEQNKHTFLTSSKMTENSFFKNRFLVLEIVENKFERVKEALKRNDAKHVVLRMSLDPREYWDLRKRFEQELSGSRKLHLFVFGETAVICHSLNFE